jgi:hypothetical protein
MAQEAQSGARMYRDLMQVIEIDDVTKALGQENLAQLLACIGVEESNMASSTHVEASPAPETQTARN